jgi:7-keto-8-aminopelargonate synthetase-like enzyme
LKQNINFARTCLKAQGIDIIGHKGPVVPVMIGDQQIARIATKELFESGILVNLIEFPAVPLEHSMLRLQISAAFSFSFILDFAKKLGRALDEARSAISVVTKNEPQSDLLLTQ